jgi:chromosome segregation ATPase
MARSAKVPPAKKPATSRRKAAAPTKAAPTKATPTKSAGTRTAATKSAAAKSAAAKPVAKAPAAAPKPSKEELRDRVETLERSIATLRSKNRDANRAAKTAAARIAELEDQVAQLEKQAAPAPAKAERKAKPSAPARSKRRAREIDPGDAVPPGVAVEDPAPLDEEAESALEHLEEHLKAE